MRMADQQLRVIEGTDRGKRLSFDADLLIGRSAPTPGGRLGDDSQISRRHARVSRGADGRLTIEDLGSANGTFVNDERISAPRALELGDVVKVGKTALEVFEPAGAVPAPAVEPPSESARRDVELVVTDGAGLGRRLIVGDELVIGREVGGAGRLADDQEVSRRHARVSRDASNQLTIEDLGSANGTFVNGMRLRAPQRLKAGDTIRIGSTALELREVQQARAPAVAEPPIVAPPERPQPVADPIPATPERRQPAPDPIPSQPERPRPSPDPIPVRPKRREPPVIAPIGRDELAAGSVIAGCRVDDVLGRGEMGVVYRAEELALQRRVALKLILPEYSRDEHFRERFRRESTVAAAIDHQNVIPVFDAGDEDGVLYITMRLVEGTDLRALIAAEGRIEPLRAARIVRQVGAALDAAHAHGMVHRDVKPSNVLLGREDHVYLTDFGLAKRAAAVDALTRQGSIVARAEYVAPEQVLNQRVDARADIYALGCLLFETLTGEPPFERWGKGPVMLAHVDAPPPSPSELCPDLPREFDEVVRRAMAKAPSDRYPSAGDLGQAALVAAGGLRRASPWSVVATGEAAPLQQLRAAEAREAREAGARAPGAKPAGAKAAGAKAAGAKAAGVEADAVAVGARPEVPGAAKADRRDVLRWALALAVLAIVAVGMVAALNGISTLH
jgi:pSer/pThr/pTyr-binding forkhead associated (FHA) protein